MTAARVIPITVFVGVDVSKDRLYVHAHPSGEAFAVARNGAGLARLAIKLRAPALVAVEATGGFETAVAASLAGDDPPSSHQSGAVRPSLSVVSEPIRHFFRRVRKRQERARVQAGGSEAFV